MPKKHSQPNKVRKRKAKDLDQITEDLQPEKLMRLTNQPIDFDLPGDGQHYCVECSRYFIDNGAIVKHRTTKVHKNQLKRIREELDFKNKV